MADKVDLRWPYGFRFDWAIKRVFKNATGPFDSTDEASLRLRPACPSLVEILRNIPDHVGDQLQSTLVSLSQFQDSLAHLQISHETKSIVLQRILGDMAGNEREALLLACSWWRQKALEHGVGYIDAVVAHYLYLGMTTDLSAQWESSRRRSDLKWEIDERQKRRLGLLATAGDHVSKASTIKAKTSDLESYLGRAEVIRDLIIYTNEKTCATLDAMVAKQDTDVESLVTLLLTEDKDTEAWKSEQLDKCKRIASIVQLSDLCEQNNWSLVICHVETDDSCGRPKLFRRLLSVVSKLDDDFTRSKAIIRPAIQPFPMFTLSEFKASDGGRTGLTWERCHPEQLEFAETFYPHIQDLKELLNKYGRHGKDEISAPASLSKDLRRKVQLFDYFDEQDDRIINPFSHFRRTVDELVELLTVNGHPSLADDQQMPLDGQTDIAEAEVDVAEAATGKLPETPRKLIIHPYQETPLHTPSRSQIDDESAEEPSTPSRAPASFTVDSEREVEIELMRSDLAVLLRATLTARDIDMSAGREAIAARLLMSKSFNEITVDRLLANPVFLERYGPEDVAIDKALPRSTKAVEGLIVSLEDDTAVVVEALLAARGIEVSAAVSVAVDGLTSELVPEEVAKRALENSRVKAKRRRKRKAEQNAALEIKKEIKLERERKVQVTGE